MGFGEVMQRIMDRVEEAADVEPEWKVRERKAEEHRIRQLEETRRRAPTDAARRLAVPTRVADAASAESFVETASTAALVSVDGIVVLSGGVGCGKSVAAARWLIYGAITDAEKYQNFLSLGTDGRWLTAAGLSRIPRFDSEETGKLFRVKRMVIDDLGDEYMDEKGAYLSLLDELINERHANNRATVVTTNLDGEAFKARYGARIADRIRGGGRFVAVDAPSLRVKR